MYKAATSQDNGAHYALSFATSFFIIEIFLDSACNKPKTELSLTALARIERATSTATSWHSGEGLR